MKTHFRKIAKVALALVYLVIVAGAIVRTTGSGMGCPDWPKCFGHYIPPTNEAELKWAPNKTFKKGQVIINNKALAIAKKDFTTGSVLDPANWEKYTKHNYAIFNPWHTWIEYINRLLGALAGLATLFLAIVSFGFWKTNKAVTVLSWLVVFGMGFQAWLGATVVYSVLAPVKITLHMLMALVILALLLCIIFKANKEDKKIQYDSTFLWLAVLALLITTAQIVMGTQVRQFVDLRIEALGAQAKDLWLQRPPLIFYVHRTFSILLLLLNTYLFYRARKYNLGHFKMYWVLFIIGVEALSGMAMYYLDFPMASQPLHMALACALFGVQFYVLLDAQKNPLSIKTS